MPTWIIAITVIVVLQTTSAYLGRLVPIAAPEFMREFGWDGSWVGYLSAANVIGALFILTAGIGTIKRLGGVLALQAGLVIGAASLVLFSFRRLWWRSSPASCIGLSNGAANPAGSEVLQRFTPPAHRNVVFSIKQAGVPLGGVMPGWRSRGWWNALGWRCGALRRRASAHRRRARDVPLRSRIDPPPEQGSAPGWSASGCPTSSGPLRSLSHAPTGCGGFRGSAACSRGRRRSG